MTCEVVLNLGSISPEDIGLEMLFTTTDNQGKQHIQDISQFELVENANGLVKYRTSVLPEKTGMYQVATRLYAKNPDLPHRQDFPLVKWL